MLLAFDAILSHKICVARDLICWLDHRISIKLALASIAILFNEDRKMRKLYDERLHRNLYSANTNTVRLLQDGWKKQSVREKAKQNGKLLRQIELVSSLFSLPCFQKKIHQLNYFDFFLYSHSFCFRFTTKPYFLFVV